jgi:hypothetical protein
LKSRLLCQSQTLEGIRTDLAASHHLVAVYEILPMSARVFLIYNDCLLEVLEGFRILLLVQD